MKANSSRNSTSPRGVSTKLRNACTSARAPSVATTTGGTLNIGSRAERNRAPKSGGRPVQIGRAGQAGKSGYSSSEAEGRFREQNPITSRSKLSKSLLFHCCPQATFGFMIEVHQTDEFKTWLRRLKDDTAVARIVARIRRMEQGNPGDTNSVEIRVDHGPGDRVYYVQRGTAIVILLCGGDKRTQARDIKRAHVMARQ